MPDAPEQRPTQTPRMILGMPAPVLAWSIAIGVVIGTVFTLIVVKPHPRPPVVAPPPARPVAVMLLEPLGPISGPPRQFRWAREAGAARYRVELLDARGTRVGLVVTADTLLPAASLTPAVPKVGAWSVVPLDGGGRELAPAAHAVFELAY
jgi:hypothetical protein